MSIVDGVTIAIGFIETSDRVGPKETIVVIALYPSPGTEHYER